MADLLGKVVRELMPPVLLKAFVSLRGYKSKLFSSKHPSSGEKGSDWYDDSFERNAHWSQHYSKSSYYFLWTVIADRIVRAHPNSIVDVGCGSGQLASLLRDKGVKKYYGIDFSPKRIAQARQVCPQFEFVETDVFQTNLFETLDYDMVLSTEFLEHVEDDLQVIQRIRPGTRFLGTVPNFPFTSHVRYFGDTRQVASRYAPFFKEFHVDDYLENDRGKTFFLIEGIKN